ncbi:TetR/AcrR family transcriptional regulator [Clostridium saccharobutylicum]|uniref:Transcriptional regulator n=1 Tax=Clostridium saccharobutylicum DSM 13864 TaxID=1345695 RepID=U5MUC3_CLOSA|nr:TetR/AcrR family transcriptional regulator [Clostridium saccharobutylicum]AGX44369.1 transcriptional regulator [Clostridium saccharobutylicum DSM 13864]AQR91662.1 putative HTH-type transcriptional regulator YvdT [Clostridium saccharobutylicum]AQS01566.1 putative HTH-type transcriptional regulator YvdT [Clostridium saccharobutylicum]AQS11176.1 putative HTH-type transcriptional regulator YvdT [Clostridium saccharobutylicum]AQS15549.1 putative HTH-type transcriptional regulator YvdT [Clostridi
MLRKERAILTKNKVFETAIELIRTKGYDNVTISEICEKAGVAKGTFYVHYKSKEDIIKESYYSDMSEFVLKNYKRLISEDNDMSIKDKIEKFLISEFEFTNYVGFEMTCRAYITNLTECISKETKHFEKRDFTKELKDLISEGIDQKVFDTNQTSEEIFLYLESFVRGFMASWCFSNSEFDIVKDGERYIKEILRKL